jgi:ribose transport system substrate-binding protein
LDKAQQLLVKYRRQVDGVFAVCEPNATGMLGALEGEGLAGKVKFIGFDPNATMVQALRDRRMHGMVLQDPVQMGYLAVKTLVAHLEGKPVEKRISTGEYMATPENMDTPQMKKLLEPEQFSDRADKLLADPKYTIAVIPKGTTHEFWKSVHAGAANAARELGNIEIIWKGPLQEDDREGQINVVQDFITKRVNGIVLAPLDAQALVASVKDAKEREIPTVVFDSGLDDPDIIVSYVATDNYNGGSLAARRLAEVLGAKGKK